MERPYRRQETTTEWAPTPRTAARVIGWRDVVNAAPGILASQRDALEHHFGKLERLVVERTAQLRRSENRHRLLLDVSNLLASKLDREELFHAIAEALGRVVSYDRISLALYDPETDSLKVAAVFGPTRPAFIGPGEELDRRSTPPGRVFDDKRPLLRSDLGAEGPCPFEKRLAAEGLRSMVIVPLLARGEAIGTLNVASKTRGSYAAEAAELLQEVAKQLALAIQNMLAYELIARLKARLERDNLCLLGEIEQQHEFEEIVGRSPGIQDVLKAVETVAPTDASVLILGETGTGKELVARAVQRLSRRSRRPLIKVNCTALVAELIESELFGHEKGAFTGAISRKSGRFELADGGTLFLDEIGDLPPELQVKLLRVLQEGEFERVGGSRTIRVDVRVVAATHRDLAQAVREGRFREDLYYRLNVFPIRVPPLRERRSDIPLLVRHFVLKYGTKLGKPVESIPQCEMDALQACTWPGNVRELENAIERAMILGAGPELRLGGWPAESRGPSQAVEDAELCTLREVERAHIERVLKQTHWRLSGKDGAAGILGLKRTTLQGRMRKLKIRRPPA